jgi:translation initiation factor 1
MSTKKPHAPVPASTAPLSYNPFASLGTPLDTQDNEPIPPPTPSPPPAALSRAVVRFSRKGHGGKDVTLVEKLELPPAELEQWLRELKAALGCGGILDGQNILLQGDHRPRLPALLKARGVRKVTVS